jgi:two-component system nitrate/nitrite response regulator NarL
MQSTLFAVIADSRTLFRQGLAALLVAGGVEVVGEAADGDDLLRACRHCKPHVIVLAANMLQPSGEPNAIEQARACCPEASVLVIGEAGAAPIWDGDSTLEAREREERAAALARGADAYLSASVENGVLLRAVRWLADGDGEEAHTSDDAELRLLVPLTGMTCAVTDRERAILALISHGMSNKEIAHRLGIHTQTVKNHVSHLLEKLAFADRTQLAVYAVENGIGERRPSARANTDSSSGSQ